MTNPSDFVVLRGGLVEHQPDDLPVLNLDVLDTDVIDAEVIEDARNLRDQVHRLAADTPHPDDHAYLTRLLAECDTWLARHAAETDEPDVDPDYEIRAQQGSGDPDYDEAIAQQAEADRLAQIGQITEILDLARAGATTPEAERAVLADYLREHIERVEDPTSLAAEVADRFPDIWEAVDEEDTCDRCGRRAPQISVGYTEQFGYDGLCNRCLDALYKAAE